ncbi:MAG TPA: zinc ribbon domain-containing protein [Bacillota bacterium]
MPIYEFRCRDCRREFEELCGMGCESLPCPSCHSRNTQRKLSTFAAKSSGSSGSQNLGGHSCGSCHGGSCSGCH